MMPLQLSSFALKQSSGPVGTHAAVTTTPSVVATFFATTFGDDAPGVDGPHAIATTKRAVIPSNRMTTHLPSKRTLSKRTSAAPTPGGVQANPTPKVTEGM